MAAINKETILKAAELAKTMDMALPDQVVVSDILLAHAMCLAKIFLRAEGLGVTRAIIENFVQQFGTNILFLYDLMKGDAADVDNQGNKSDKYKTTD